MKDQVHQERYIGSSIWKDDMIQFAFTRRNGIPERVRGKTDQSARHGESDYCIGMVLCKNGPEVYACKNGKKQQGSLSWPAKISRSEAYPVYEIAVPLEELRLKPEMGQGLRFGFVIMDNNRAGDASARY